MKANHILCSVLFVAAFAWLAGCSDTHTDTTGTDGDVSDTTDGDTVDTADGDTAETTDGDTVETTDGDATDTTEGDTTDTVDQDDVLPDNEMDFPDFPDNDTQGKGLGHRCAYTDASVSVNANSGACQTGYTCVVNYDKNVTCTTDADCQDTLAYGHTAACVTDGITSFCAASWCSVTCGTENDCSAMTDYGTACCGTLAGGAFSGGYCIPGDNTSMCPQATDGDSAEADVAEETPWEMDMDFDRDRDSDAEGELTEETCTTTGETRCDGNLAEHCSRTGYWKIDADCAAQGLVCNNGVCE